MSDLNEDALRREYARKTKAELVDALIKQKIEQQDPAHTAERMAFFGKATTEGMLIHHNGLITDANGAALRLLATTREKLIGKLVHEFVVGGWHDRVTAGVTTKSGRQVEAIWTRENGSSFICECHNIKRPSGKQVLHFREVKVHRRPSEERLRLAEEMWDLYNNTPCGYHSLDENGLVLRMNATELDWLGYEYSEVVGAKTFEKLLAARSQEYYRRIYPELARRGWLQDLEFDMERKDGSVFPILVSATGVYDTAGRMVMSRFTVFDISELKRATKDLRDSEEKFRAIAEQSLIGIFIIQDDRIIYGNESMHRIFGYTAQELLDLGQNGFNQLIHSSDREVGSRTISRLLLEGDTLPPRDLRGLHKNGESLWLELSASHVLLRGHPSVFGMVANISEKKKNEIDRQSGLSRAVRHQTAISQMATCEALTTGDLRGSLREITEQAAWALDAARTSVWLMNEDESLLHCHMCYERTDDTHSQPIQILEATDIPHYFQALSSGRTIVAVDLEGKRSPSTCLNLKRDLGQTTTLDAAIRLAGNIVGAFCVEHEGYLRKWTLDETAFVGEVADQVAHAIISQRRRVAETALRRAETKVRALNTQLERRVKHTTEELSQAKNKLVEKEARVGMADIATAVLHNVGNILTSVITSGQTIEKTVQTSSIRSMRKANKLLDELLDDQDPKAARLIEFYNVLEDLLTKEHGEINENVEQVLKKIDLIRDVITAQQSYASTDSQSEQLFLPDIMDDALNIQEHTLGRYDVTVERHYHEVPMVFISKIKLVHVLINLIKNAREAMVDNQGVDRIIRLFVGREGRQAIIKVRDNGHGIPEENLGKVFTHGFSTKKDGHGFGLHSCRVAMEEMGGTIRVESEGPGLGTTFIISFPIPEEELQLDL